MRLLIALIVCALVLGCTRATIADVPTPTLDPTAATPVPVPTHTPSEPPQTGREHMTGLWLVSEEVNPIDDTLTVTAILFAKEGKGVSGDPVTLVLRCKSNRVEAFIMWFSDLGNDDPTITYRFGTETALTNRWSLSNDSDTTFYRGNLNELDADYIPFHVAFVKKLMTVDRFVARVISRNETSITAVFDLTGVEHAGEQVLDACF